LFEVRSVKMLRLSKSATTVSVHAVIGQLSKRLMAILLTAQDGRAEFRLNWNVGYRI